MGNFSYVHYGEHLCEIISNQFCLFDLFDLILYVTVNNFSVMSGWVFLG